MKSTSKTGELKPTPAVTNLINFNVKSNTANIGGQENPFEKLPMEILAEIFSKLDVENLKICRQVCHLWNQIIKCEKLFLSRICAVHKAIQNSDVPDRVKAEYFAEGSRLIVAHLRLRQIYSCKYVRPNNLFLWMTSDFMSHVTHLDLRNCQLLLSHFLLILNEFEHISKLSISDETLIWTPHEGPPEEHPEFYDFHWVNSKRHLVQVKSLRIVLNSLHTVLQTFNRFDLLTFGNLVEVELAGTWDLRSQSVIGLETIVANLLALNLKTLKILKFEGVLGQVKMALDKSLAANDCSDRTDMYTEFEHFLDAIRSYLAFGDTKWISQLEVLSLNRFPIANMSDSRVVDNMVPFLKKFPNLREVYFAQAYFSNDSHFHQFVKIFPQACKVFLESVHLHVPNVDLNNIAQVVHTNMNILKYKNCSVEMKWDNLFWKINYLTWDKLANTVLHQNLNYLRKLRFHLVLFPFRDEELQMIIMGAKQLTELHFNQCDLKELTDSGLTGLSFGVCLRVRADLGYLIAPQDFIGVPLSSMEYLASLKLSNVGEFVTDTTIKVAFKGLKKLRNLTIFQEPRLLISREAISIMKENKNIVVQYEHSSFSQY